MYRYLLKELFPSFFLGLMGFTFILLTGRILQLTELFVNKRVPFHYILSLLYFLLPSFLVLTIPMATLLSVLMTFNRLSSDNEITAFKASGVSLYQLTPPVFILALTAYLGTSFLAIYSLPRTNQASRSLLYEIASSKAHAGVRERVFNDEFEGLVLYVERVDQKNQKWEKVFISDSRNPAEVHTIIAPEGFVQSNPERMTVTLALQNGSIHKLGKESDSYQKINFSTYDLRLDLKTEWKGGKKDDEKHPADMSLRELARTIRALRSKNADTKSQWIKVHEKFSIPFACLVFGLIAVPLGLQSRTSKAIKSMGFAWSIGVLLVYYLITNAGTSLAERGIILLEVGMWAPNVLFFGLGIYLLVKAGNESPVFLLVMLSKLIERTRKRLNHSWRSKG
ncbi:MAG: LPS export ABC transporter permease LptF [Deltaproteobacteria bacterium]|nr:LPS export ABC transporter permease LptF [Deltaproteobacteria bacterium]